MYPTLEAPPRVFRWYDGGVLAPDEARARILAALSDVAPLAGERVPLAAALGRALADDLRAEAELPSFDASTMDGYALRAADARRPGARLAVAFEVFAGRPATAPLPPGACCPIFTRAPLPRGFLIQATLDGWTYHFPVDVLLRSTRPQPEIVLSMDGHQARQPLGGLRLRGRCGTARVPLRPQSDGEAGCGDGGA